MKYNIQVEKEHYFRWRYLSRDRWMNFWYQLDAVRRSNPASVLEIGVGNRIVSETLKKLDIAVTTVDIDPELNPDVVGSVVSLPFPDNSFDAVLAAEILEHIPWEEFPKAIAQIRRVSKKHAVITLPHAGYTFALIWKIPLIPWQRWFYKIPHFWKKHVFNGEHYWETGKRGYSLARVRREIRKAGFTVLDSGRFPDDPAHYRLILEKSL